MWSDLAVALNALEDAGLAPQFADRLGPETDWKTAPYVYAASRAGQLRTAWDRTQRRWVVEQQ
ncbi:hypothetical protein M1P56_09785 [Streptomyces sp. HU2014]|uniref:hypothetical protein n=1 Tax=Streptomyces sp. HU2014 TaxID=2939414 RepID=UPI00200DCD0C|nr:hypothetical protein [Streptomyces sp. HU2014]UQI44616.1 hypothetical protein M1P56_09785 [Streptomyces sp. HU2014]